MQPFLLYISKSATKLSPVIVELLFLCAVSLSALKGAFK